MEELNEYGEGRLTVKDIIALVLADVDTFLLKDETDPEYKTNFTRNEVIEQLEQTGKKIYTTLEQMGCKLDKELEFDPVALMMFELSMRSDKTIN